ncbi:hypothetical protein QTP70_025307 [Hemibagrus guttatus]|uniref:Tc1-like transposase DDE domain-containing protein n=1 Tax=Hemibagrus guttatus TaxID=175788 RepID=A0AAE0UPX1_9TELE|nr:hypothetical protein QTP70_025307 [Hemibagrus guttatus]
MCHKATCHKAKMVQEWFDEHNNEFEVLTWSPNSPDLYPIEHLWDMLDKQDGLSECHTVTWFNNLQAKATWLV